MPKSWDDMEAAAIGWVIRLRDARAGDWEAFAAWLESDPKHANIYEEVALVDAALDGAPSDPLRGSMQQRDGTRARWPSRRMIMGWGFAASILAPLGYLSLSTHDNLVTIKTAAGARRSLTLTDGSRIDLNGATILALDRKRPRWARLESGEALFTVVHDAARPFGVEAVGTYIKDLGTVFNVVVNEAELEVSVAEGLVIFNPHREAVRLSAGMAIRTEGSRASIIRRSAESVGAWRSGHLSYHGARFSRVAEDLSRNMGITVRVDPAVANRRFSGVIVLDTDQEVVFRRVAGLLDVDARRTAGGGWNLGATRGS